MIQSLSTAARRLMLLVPLMPLFSQYIKSHLSKYWTANAICVKSGLCGVMKVCNLPFVTDDWSIKVPPPKVSLFAIS